MKRKKVYFLFVICALVLSGYLFNVFFFNNNDSILKEYNYRINSDYLEYLSLNDDEKDKVNIIPLKYTYSSNNSLLNNGSTSLPKKYDLRNVDNNNYVTPIKNQMSYGLCWAFSSVAVMESSVILHGYENINNPLIFSEYQLDFALSDDGIDNYSGSDRQLTTGGHPLKAANFINKGYSPVSLNNFGMEFYKSYPINYYDVFEVQNSEYFFSDSVHVVGTVDESLVNNIKKYLLTYGPLSVSTESPIGDCSHTDQNDYIFLDVNASCKGGLGHAMAVIGWDDDYTEVYSSDGTNYEVNGAWILKNSWGDIYPIIYLSYNSSFFASFDGLSIPELVNFDNSYNEAIDNVNDNTLISRYNKPSDSREKITKISFYHNSYDNSEFRIYISKDGSDNFAYIDTVNVSFPGRTSIDMSVYNDDYTLLDSDSFAVKIESDNNEHYSLYSNVESAYVFTKNIDLTDDIGVKINENTKELNYYDKTISINITPNSFIQKKNLNIRILDINNEDITNGQLSLLKFVKKNQDYIYLYNVNEQFSKDNDTILKVQVYYENNLIGEKNITVHKNEPISPYGDGSVEYPFIITNEQQFLSIAKNEDLMSYSYVLGNDLDFSNYTDLDFYEPIGTYNSPFTGTFDGNNHIISNLNANYKTQFSSLGLFGYTKNAVIKNIKIENCSFTSDKSITNFGMLSGSDYNSEISNISIYGGTSSMHVSYSGSFIGKSELGAYNNIYSSHSLNIEEPLDSGGLIGYFSNGGIYVAAFVGNFEYQSEIRYGGGVAGSAINSTITFVDVSFSGYSERGYQGIANELNNSIVDNVLVYVKTNQGSSSKNSYISSVAIGSQISNIYQIDYAGYNYDPISPYGGTSLIGIKHVNYDSSNMVETFNMNTEKWEFVDSRPYLVDLNYTIKKFSLPWVSYEYLFDPDNLIIYNVRLPERNTPLTYKAFKELFEIYNGDAYSVDGTKQLDDDDYIVTGIKVLADGYSWRIAVTGMLDVQNDRIGIIDIGDVTVMQRILGRFPVYTNVLSEDEYRKIINYAGDLNCSNSFDIGDVTILRRKLALFKLSSNIYMSDGKSCYEYSNGGVK